jgi:SulP family sulfate permease
LRVVDRRFDRMMSQTKLRGDILGGITTGVVALPLALAFGEASGLGPIAGVWGAIILGFLAAAIGGTPTLISGPTGPILIVIAGLVAARPDQPAVVASVVILAGILQTVFGFLRLGKYINLVPYSVVAGFMSGIGLIVIVLQLIPLIGQEAPRGGTLATLTALPSAVEQINAYALGLGVLTFAVATFWPKSLSKFFPAALAALLVGTVASLLVSGALPRLDEIPTGFPDLVLPSLDMSDAIFIVQSALVLAALGSIDTLVTSLIADRMTQTRHQSNKELVGQGIGNAVCGLFGAMPGSGTTTPTVVNIRSGGATRLSGMVHALFLLAVVFLLAPLAAQIPLAVLAGLLVRIGLNIIDLDYLRNALRGPRWDLSVMVLVVGLTVFVDLITAVGVGVVLSALGFVKRLADAQIANFESGKLAALDAEEQAILKDANGRILLFDFAGPLSFGAAADLVHIVRRRSKREVRAIVLDFSRKFFADRSAVQAIQTIVSESAAQGIEVFFAGASPDLTELLAKMEADIHVDAEHRDLSRREALARASKLASVGRDGALENLKRGSAHVPV